MKCGKLLIAGAIALLCPLPSNAQMPAPALSIVPHVGIGVPIHFVVGVAADAHVGSRTRAVAQVERWNFQGDCLGIGPCFETGTLVDAGVNMKLGAAVARLRPYIGSAAGAIRRRDTQLGELHRNWTVRGRAGAEWHAPNGGVAWRGEAGVVHLFDESGHGTGPLVYLSLGAAIPLLRRR